MLHLSNVHLYVFTEFTFDMDPVCIARGHACLLLSMGIPTLGRYCIFGLFPCLTCRCFSNPCAQDPTPLPSYLRHRRVSK